jgi:hypothetical protein
MREEAADWFICIETNGVTPPKCLDKKNLAEV